ncbi:hypothetical protein FEM48_Zijuj07G0045200 [Ziziphus jujuba var. spinosa]|uniref:Uncharacterized protein n=1 Tax=Ziziphus jujuba var. spinosa TaxID=714518 RepID=A0A978V2G5_ZIZJJ|nr:hypothetical protein FEM48_Zijuj07G0045200 [Ziziphus jujuba var. spinosa]
MPQTTHLIECVECEEKIPYEAKHSNALTPANQNVLSTSTLIVLEIQKRWNTLSIRITLSQPFYKCHLLVNPKSSNALHVARESTMYFSSIVQRVPLILTLNVFFENPPSNTNATSILLYILRRYISRVVIALSVTSFAIKIYFVVTLAILISTLNVS